MSTSRGHGDPLNNLEQTLVEVEQVPKVQRIERRINRRSQIVVVVSAIAVLLSIAWNGWNTIQISQNEAKSTAQDVITEDGLQSLKAANEKLVEQGLPEIPLPREGQPVDADAIAAAAAALMYDRIKNDPSFRGSPGLPGHPCTPQVPGCTGPEGKPGTWGPRGPEGPKGEDAPPVSDEKLAEMIEAYCSREPSPCVGPPGPQGPPGDQGLQGDVGQMGPEGPYCLEGFEPRKKFVATDDAPLGEILLVCDEI